MVNPLFFFAFFFNVDATIAILLVYFAVQYLKTRQYQDIVNKI